MAFDCEYCGATGFVHRGSLGSHQSRNSRCRRLQKAAQRTSPIPASPRGASLDDWQGAEDDQMQVDTQESDGNRSGGTSNSTGESDGGRHRNTSSGGESDGNRSGSTSSGGESDGNRSGSTSCGGTGNEDIWMGQTKDFDSSFHLAHFIRHCRNSAGLSQKDITSLFAMLFHPSFRLEELRYRSFQEFKAYEKELIRTSQVKTEDGYEWKEVLVCPGESDLKLRYRDPVGVLGKLFSARKNRREFVLKPEVSGTEEYTTAQTGLWWRKMEEHVGCEGAVIAPIILYSDATSLSHDQRTSGYPLVMSLGNIACATRSLEHGHALLAILPTIGSNDPVVLHASNSRLKKLEIFQQCLELILQPLKEASFKGLHLKDPFGCHQWVFPMLYSYIADHPEGCKVSCTFDTNKCAFPCSVCLCPRNLLSRVDLKHEWRTEASMIVLQNQLAEMIDVGQVAAANRLSSESSVHPVKCALLGFNGGDTELGNCFRAIQVEILHESDLGLAKMLVAALRGVAAAGLCLTQKPLEVLDQRLRVLQTQHRYSAFRIPGNNSHGYFISNANFAAFEHRAVMQVLVLCMPGVFSPGVIQVIVKFLDWYKLACRSGVHNEETLQQMEDQMSSAVTSMKSILGGFQASNFDTVKVHAMTHFSDCIRRSGLPWEYSANMYEHMHIMLMKMPYRASNRRRFTDQIVQHHKRLEALRSEAENMEGFEPKVERVTPLDEAVRTGKRKLCGHSVRIKWKWLLASTTVNLPVQVARLFEAQPELQQHLVSQVQIYLNDWHLTRQQGRALMTKGALAVAAGPGDRLGDWPMYLRATYNFHRRPWYSDVSIQMEGEAQLEQTWYGQLRLLFQLDVEDEDRSASKLDLAFVKLYKELPASSLSRLSKCKELAWADATRGCTGYLVVETASILRAHHLVPNWNARNRWFINKYKF